jgi:hypothetical protein
MLLKRLPPFFAPVALALAGAGAACASCVDESSSTPDGGLARTDARVPDAGTRDARDDAQEVEDTGTSDWSWLQGQWDPLPAPYDSCPIRIARTPDAVGISTRWKPCPSGRMGCLKLDQAWTTIKGRKILTLSFDPVMKVDGVDEPVLLYRQMFPKDEPPGYFASKLVTIATKLSGSVLFAQALDVERTAQCVSWTSTANSGLTSGAFLYTSGRSRLEYRDLVTTRAQNSEIQSPFAGAAGTYGGSWPTIFLKDGADRWLQVAVDSGIATQTARLQGLDGPRPVKSGFIARNFETGLPILHIGHDGSIEKLLTTAPGLNVSGYAVDRTDNERLVWVEAEGLAPSQNPVLYTSPWAASESLLTKRRLTAYDDPAGFGGGYMIVANGHALLLTERTRAILVRLTDGAHWIIDADPGYGWATPMWVDANEVWLEGAKRTFNGTGRDLDIQELSFYRIRRDTLGAPTSAR